MNCSSDGACHMSDCQATALKLCRCGHSFEWWAETCSQAKSIV